VLAKILKEIQMQLKQRINRKSKNNTKSEISWKKCFLVWQVMTVGPYVGQIF